jgi:hypothetical protein
LLYCTLQYNTCVTGPWGHAIELRGTFRVLKGPLEARRDYGGPKKV